MVEKNIGESVELGITKLGKKLFGVRVRYDSNLKKTLRLRAKEWLVLDS